MRDFARGTAQEHLDGPVFRSGSPMRLFTRLATHGRVLGPDLPPPGPGTAVEAARSRATSWMLAHLARATSSAHAVIDEAVMAVAEEPTLASYRYLLARLYGFDAPLLANLLVTPGLDLSLLANRPRASDLANDLLALGITPREATMLQRRHEVPRFACVAEALGWLYASERITLCHPMIRARLRAVLPGALKVAGAYVGRTRTPHVAWTQLGRYLDRIATCELVAAQIVDAADAALASQRRWFDATALDVL